MALTACPGLTCKNFANNKSSLPVGILQNNTSESTINPLKIWRPLNKKVCPRKKKMPEKILKFLPEKKTTQPEKKFANVPEKTSKCPRKNFQKCPRKTISAREKKPKKYQKPFSRALFIFSGKKKTLKQCTHFDILNFSNWDVFLNLTVRVSECRWEFGSFAELHHFKFSHLKSFFEN